MGRGRRGAFLGGAASLLLAALLAVGVESCADATQIIVEVRADQALCEHPDGIETGIAVSTPAEIDTEDLEIFEKGCDGEQSIGKLTIVPRGEKNAEVGIRIVLGVGKPAVQCRPPWDDCIVARRTIQFVPRRSNYLTVYLSEACISKQCPEGQECHLGECKDREDILPDGGSAPPDADTPVPRDASDDGPPIVDAGQDACALCSGPGHICDGTTGRCTVSCSGQICRNEVLCPPELDCVVECESPNECQNVRCSDSARSCTFECTQQGACSNVQCSRGVCNVTCGPTQGSCNGVHLDGGTNDVQCRGDGPPSCNDVHCSGGGDCKRTCGIDKLACGPIASCEPQEKCGAWENAPPPGDGGS